jgi:hypothetical protein
MTTEGWQRKETFLEGSLGSAQRNETENATDASNLIEGFCADVMPEVEDQGSNFGGGVRRPTPMAIPPSSTSNCKSLSN